MDLLTFGLMVLNNPKVWEFLIACLVVAIAAGWPYGQKQQK